MPPKPSATPSGVAAVAMSNSVEKDFEQKKTIRRL